MLKCRFKIVSFAQKKDVLIRHSTLGKFTIGDAALISPVTKGLIMCGRR